MKYLACWRPTAGISEHRDADLYGHIMLHAVPSVLISVTALISNMPAVLSRAASMMTSSATAQFCVSLDPAVYAAGG